MDDGAVGNSTPSRDGGTAGRSTTTSTSQPAAPPSRQLPNPDRPTGAAVPPKTRVVQPTPQALPQRSGPSSVIVSTRQKGNPILQHIKGVPWEYGDIPADYVLGLTTCALFLSLKYHRLHPEYIYTRIRGLQGRYQLRVVLVLVDMPNHEASLRELSKTSLINNVTLVLCWSAAEGGRYLELFKTYEHAAPTAIRQRQSGAYADRMVDFVTTPRSVTKTDAVALVSQFGSVRTAVNARHEEVAAIAGWGEKKVQQWCAAVREPFRVRRAAKRGLPSESSRAEPPAEVGDVENISDGGGNRTLPAVDVAAIQPSVPAKDIDDPPPAKRPRQDPNEEALSEGITAALSRLREKGAS